jgi:hypothetical protein
LLALRKEARMQTIEMSRDLQINIRLTPDEQTRFERVAKHYGLNVANVIRYLVRREEQDIFERDREHWKRGAAAWERDKAYIEWLVPLVNIMKLAVAFDERTRTVTIISTLVPPTGKKEGLTPYEAIDLLAKWPEGFGEPHKGARSDIVEIDPHSRVVKHIPKGSHRVETKAPPPEAVDASFMPSTDAKPSKRSK